MSKDFVFFRNFLLLFALSGAACYLLLPLSVTGAAAGVAAGWQASRLGITTVVSTDSIRHMLRRWVAVGWGGVSRRELHVGILCAEA